LSSASNIVIALGLAHGPINGNFYVMKTTIDHAGRLVIPKDIRRESGIKPGMPLEVRWEKGAIAITPAPLAVRLERKGRLLVAVPTKDTPRLSKDTVERTRKALARNARVIPPKHGARFSSGYKLHDCGRMFVA
jgi:AbrB family looped-hinge helix DNA binding protein